MIDFAPTASWYAIGWFAIFILAAWTNFSLRFRSGDNIPPFILMFVQTVVGALALVFCAAVVYEWAGMPFFGFLFDNAYNMEVLYAIGGAIGLIGLYFVGVVAPGWARRYGRAQQRVYEGMEPSAT